jgi:hypothetical protein
MRDDSANGIAALEKRKGLIGKHLPARHEKAMEINDADVAELVDARDLKSLDGNVVWVRVPPPAPRSALTGYAWRSHADCQDGACPA